MSKKILLIHLLANLIQNLQESVEPILQPLKTSIENVTEQIKKLEQRCIEMMNTQHVSVQKLLKIMRIILKLKNQFKCNRTIMALWA